MVDYLPVLDWSPSWSTEGFWAGALSGFLIELFFSIAAFRAAKRDRVRAQEIGGETLKYLLELKQMSLLTDSGVRDLNASVASLEVRKMGELGSDEYERLRERVVLLVGERPRTLAELQSEVGADVGLPRLLAELYQLRARGEVLWRDLSLTWSSTIRLAEDA